MDHSNSVNPQPLLGRHKLVCFRFCLQHLLCVIIGFSHFSWVLRKGDGIAQSYISTCTITEPKAMLSLNRFTSWEKLLTWIWAIHVDKFGPLVMFHKADQGILELGPELDYKLIIGVDWEAGSHEADMQSSTERHQHVHGLLVI